MNQFNMTQSSHSEVEMNIGKVITVIKGFMGHLFRRTSLGGPLWNEVLRNLKLVEIVGFSQERKVLFTRKKKEPELLFINKYYMEDCQI